MLEAGWAQAWIHPEKWRFFLQDMHARGRMGTSLECPEETNDRGREGTSLDCFKKVAISVNSVYGRGKTDTSLECSKNMAMFVKGHVCL